MSNHAVTDANVTTGNTARSVMAPDPRKPLSEEFGQNGSASALHEKCRFTRRVSFPPEKSK